MCHLADTELIWPLMTFMHAGVSDSFHRHKSIVNCHSSPSEIERGESHPPREGSPHDSIVIYTLLS